MKGVLIMKKKFKRAFAVLMAVVTLSMGFQGTGVLAAGGVMPLYNAYKDISFNVSIESATPYKQGEVRVDDAPAKVTYRTCTTGVADLEIYVNGVYYDTYHIPVAGAQAGLITQFISCSVGDIIKYRVKPAYGYTRASGSFRIYH